MFTRHNFGSDSYNLCETPKNQWYKFPASYDVPQPTPREVTTQTDVCPDANTQQEQDLVSTASKKKAIGSSFLPFPEHTSKFSSYLCSLFQLLPPLETFPSVVCLASTGPKNVPRQ